MPPRLAFAILLISWVLLVRIASADPTVGFMETWSGTTTHNWGGGSSVTNPGTGGVDGAGDGFLLVATPTVGRLGTRSYGASYIGDWIAAGVTFVRFSIKDVGTDDPLEIHFSIGNSVSFWQSNTAILPPENTWGEVTIHLMASEFTRIRGAGTFDQALQNADRIHFRNDNPPFTDTPDEIRGDFGIDNLLLGNATTPTLSSTWGRIKALYR
jgi:hypothetical protein